jgi:hypothetical protein
MSVNRAAVISLACCGFMAGEASAQGGQGMGTWVWEVVTQNGDAIVEPGETATVSLFIDMEPSVGERLPDGFELYGFLGGTVDVIGGNNAANGQIVDWEPNPILIALKGKTGKTDGVSIFDVILGQLVTFDDPFDPSDPIHLLSFEWQPVLDEWYTVDYDLMIATETGDFEFGIWKWDGENIESFATEIWSIRAGAMQFQVVPAPPPAVAIGISALMLFAPRRRQ